jgi:hypothetical protein
VKYTTRSTRRAMKRAHSNSKEIEERSRDVTVEGQQLENAHAGPTWRRASWQAVRLSRLDSSRWVHITRRRWPLLQIQFGETVVHQRLLMHICRLRFLNTPRRKNGAHHPNLNHRSLTPIVASLRPPRLFSLRGLRGIRHTCIAISERDDNLEDQHPPLQFPLLVV